MVLKVLWIKTLFIKLINSSKHSLILAKTGIEVHLMHEFLPPEPFLVFSNEHAQSTTLGLKLMFWMVSCHFVAPPDPLKKIVSGGI